MSPRIRLGHRGRRGAVGEYVGRGTPLGNPYAATAARSREEACRLYASWFSARLRERDPRVATELTRLRGVLHDRGTVTLLCSCWPRTPCHAETIKAWLEVDHVVEATTK